MGSYQLSRGDFGRAPVSVCGMPLLTHGHVGLRACVLLRRRSPRASGVAESCRCTNSSPPQLLPPFCFFFVFFLWTRARCDAQRQRQADTVFALWCDGWVADRNAPSQPEPGQRLSSSAGRGKLRVKVKRREAARRRSPNSRPAVRSGRWVNLKPVRCQCPADLTRCSGRALCRSGCDIRTWLTCVCVCVILSLLFFFAAFYSTLSALCSDRLTGSRFVDHSAVKTSESELKLFTHLFIYLFIFSRARSSGTRSLVMCYDFTLTVCNLTWSGTNGGWKKSVW